MPLAPVLDHNQRARLQDLALCGYIPRLGFLSLVNLADGTAIGTTWGVIHAGRAAMWLKDRIVHALMKRYR